MSGTLRTLAAQVWAARKNPTLLAGAASLTLRGASIVVSIALMLILTRTMGAEGYGVFAVHFSLATIAVSLIQFGLPQLLIRETARLQARRANSARQRLWSEANHIALGYAVALLTVTLIAVWFMPETARNYQRELVLLCIPLAVLMAQANISAAKIHGLGHAVLGQVQEFLLRPLGVIVAALVAVFLAKMTLSPRDVLFAYLASATLALIVSALLQWRKTAAAERSAPKEAPATKDASPSRLGMAFRLGAAGSANVINFNVGILVIGALSTADQAALLRVAFQGSTLLALGIFAIGAVMAPRFAAIGLANDDAITQKDEHSKRSLNAQRQEALNSLLVLAARLSAIATLPIALFLLLFGKPVLGLAFGAEFEAAYPALALFCIMRLYQSLFGSPDITAIMLEREHWVIGCMFVAVALNVALLLWLVPIYGALGGALAFVVSGAGTTTVLSYLLWRKEALNCFIVKSRQGK